MSTTVNVEVVWYIFFECPEEIKFGLVFYVIFVLKPGKPLLLLFLGGGYKSLLTWMSF